MSVRFVRNLGDDSPLIVFVHGVLSDSDKCWGENGGRWPEIAAGDSTLKDWSIVLVDYHTAVNSGKYSVSDAAISLWHELASSGAFNGRSLLFVCHSMGGIVVRRMLLQHQGEISRHATIGLLLVASPTNGSLWARAFYVFPRLLGHSQVLALRPVGSNESLRELNIDFRYALGRNHLNVLGEEIYEHLLIGLGKYLPWLRPIVYGQEAYGVFPERPVQIPNTTHFSITCPDSASSLQHLALQRVVGRVRGAMYTLQFSVPSGACWADLEGLLEQMLRMPVDFTEFTEAEMNAPLISMRQIRGVSPKGLALDLRNAAATGAIRSYEVEEDSGVLRFRLA